MILKSFICLLLILGITAKYYSIDSNLKIKVITDELDDLLEFDWDSIANGQLIDTHNTTGWAYFTVNTAAGNPDWAQTYAAGYLEGYVTYDLIYATKKNKEISMLEKGFITMPDKAAEFIKNQTNWMNMMVANNPEDSYWGMVNSTLSQLYGMYAGYSKAVSDNNRTDMNLTFDDFYTITYAVDLPDIVSKYSIIDLHLPRCSFLLKMTNESLYVSQTTWSDYTDMVRIYKVYNFNLQNPFVNSKRMSFSSQPGAISSQDDFYIVDDNRVVAETTLVAYNPFVYEWLHYDSVPYWVRVTVANLVFTDQSSWADAFFNYRSGTYNNQWLVINFNNYNTSKNNLTAAKDIIWMIEEFYSLSSAIDVTQELLVPQGYVASYNSPYNKTIWDLSKNLDAYDKNPRCKLFEKYAPGIQTFEDFQNVMRMNNHSDTHLYCEAIAARCDLQSSIDLPFGAIDCKATSDSLVGDHKAWIQSGPSYENLPVFNWTEWTRFNKNLVNMPEVFNFPWEFVDPDTNFTAPAMLSEPTEAVESLIC